MTYPPQGSDEHGPDDAGPAHVEPTPPVPTPGTALPGYGQPPSYGATPPYNPNPPYGAPQQPPYGQPAYGQAPPYGQPQYGQTPQYGAPQYGPPQYAAAQYGAPGQPFAPPPTAPKSKVGLIALLTGVALLVIAGVVVLVISLQSTVLDASSAERDVAAQFEQREGVAIDLHCPNDMKVKKGASYTCTGKTADGESVTLKLVITDEKTAAYTWTEP